MPLLESLIGLTQRGGTREPAQAPLGNQGGNQGGEQGAKQRARKAPQPDSSLTAGGEDTWTPRGPAAPRGTELVLSRVTKALERGFDGTGRGCGNVFCRSVWTPPWKSREHPIFEGKWACSPGCAEALVRSALARETGEWPEDDVPIPHRHRIPLGLVLLAHGWITHATLQRALEAQRANGFGRIGEWLVSECGVSPEEVTRGLSAQWNCPVLTVDGFAPQTTALALPRLLIEEYGALPLRVAGGGLLYVGFRDQLDAACSFAIGQMSGLKTESGVMGEANFRRVRERLLQSRFPRQSLAEEADRDTLADAVAATIERARPAASKLLKLHRYYWLRIWSNGGKCRPGSTLPASADAVTDYLFTIARPTAAALERGTPERVSDRRIDARPPEPRTGGRIDVQVAAQVETAARKPNEAEAPISVAAPIEAAEPIAEPIRERNTELASATGAEMKAERRVEAGKAPVGESAGVAVGDARAEDAALALLEESTLGAGETALAVVEEQVSEAGETALAVVEEQVSEVGDEQRPVALGRHLVLQEAVSEQQIERAERIAAIERFEPTEAAIEPIEPIEPIDGEYLPIEPLADEPAPRSATSFLFLHRRSDWKSFQVWTQRSLSFLRRGEGPASGPGQEG